MSAGRATARAAGLAAAVVAVDQATKALVRDGIRRGDSDAVFPGIQLVNVRNPGVAFGFLADGGTVVAVVTGLALLALLAFFARNATRALAWLPTGLLVGGAAGNVVDRLREGAVTDFIDLPLWPAFNVADIAITVGVLALLYVIEGPKAPARDG